MAGFTASWVHGNAVVVEDPPADDGGLYFFNHFGWGTQIVIGPGSSRWFHVALPTPVILDAKRLKVIRVFLQLRIERLGSLDGADLWDGDTKVATITDFKDKPDVQFPGILTFELFEPLACQRGLGLSFHLEAQSYANGNFVDDKNAPMFVIGSAGADYDVS
ncbi:MAG TPA: hypothetical protein VGK21_05100 [Candidatus Angelobacter sp.]|jgi:hypothetical protein